MGGIDFWTKVKDYLLQNVDDLLNPYFWTEIILEFVLCSWILTIVIWALVTGATAPTTSFFGLFAGFIIMALIEGYGPMCGCPINPAGVWGFFLAGRISVVRAIFYMAAEIAGAATGGKIGYALSSANQTATFGPILPAAGITLAQGMAVEAILSFNLIFVALTCTNPKTRSVMASFPIAFCVGTGIMAGGAYTGGLQNPIVPFGPAVATGNFTSHFEVYWAGPFIGTTVGSLFWTLINFIKVNLDLHRFPPTEIDEEEERRIKEIQRKQHRRGSKHVMNSDDNREEPRERY